MRTFETRTVKLAILPKGEPIFSEKATYLESCDEGTGGFVSVSQPLTGPQDKENPEIRIDDDEWPAIRAGVNRLFADIRKHSFAKRGEKK